MKIFLICGAIKSKLKNLLRSHSVRLVYLTAGEKWIVKPAQNDSSRVTRRIRSGHMGHPD